jgi:KUP system potassium uptake protein
VGEEDVIAGQGLRPLHQMRIWLFRWILRVATPAHKYLGLVYDAAISKQIIPVVFTRDDAKVALPELEIDSASQSTC